VEMKKWFDEITLELTVRIIAGIVATLHKKLTSFVNISTKNWVPSRQAGVQLVPNAHLFFFFFFFFFARQKNFINPISKIQD
jgi:uncharacterized membrane protein